MFAWNSITIVTNKIASSSDLQVIENYIKNVNFEIQKLTTS